MTQSEVRQAFIRYNPGVRRLGRKGYWYICARCGKWCGRDNREKANLKDSEKMEVDHIRPWADGGSDSLYNLQALCKPCNRKKSTKPGFKDSVKIIKNDIVHADGIKSSVRKAGRQNKILKGLGITKRR